MPKKFDRCVKKVRAKNRNVNPYAVCHASMNKKILKDKNSKTKIKHSKCLYCDETNPKKFWDDDNQVCIKCRGF